MSNGFDRLKMTAIKILIDIMDMERRLELLQQQKPFLITDSSLPNWIILFLKCLIAGYGKTYLSNRCMTVSFFFGTILHTYTKVISWFMFAFCNLFIIASGLDFSHEGRNKRVSVLFWTTFWILFSPECEFYMDIHLVLCFLGFICKMYDNESMKATTFILLFNWILDKADIFNIDDVHLVFAGYIFLFFVLRPSMGSFLEYEFNKRFAYYCINLVVLLMLIFKYVCGTAQMNVCFQELSNLFLVRLNDTCSYVYELYVLFDPVTFFHYLTKVRLMLFQPQSIVQQICLYINSSYSVEDALEI